MHSMKMVADDIPGYAYGTSEVGVSPVSLRELEDLKISAGFAEEDQRDLKLAGEILADQTKQLIDHWRTASLRASLTSLGTPARPMAARS